MIPLKVVADSLWSTLELIVHPPVLDNSSLVHKVELVWIHYLIVVHNELRLTLVVDLLLVSPWVLLD